MQKSNTVRSSSGAHIQRLIDLALADPKKSVEPDHQPPERALKLVRPTLPHRQEQPSFNAPPPYWQATTCVSSTEPSTEHLDSLWDIMNSPRLHLCDGLNITQDIEPSDLIAHAIVYGGSPTAEELVFAFNRIIFFNAALKPQFSVSPEWKAIAFNDGNGSIMHAMRYENSTGIEFFDVASDSHLCMGRMSFEIDGDDLVVSVDQHESFAALGNLRTLKYWVFHTDGIMDVERVEFDGGIVCSNRITALIPNGAKMRLFLAVIFEDPAATSSSMPTPPSHYEFVDADPC